jgi:hypothetical protein
MDEESKNLLFLIGLKFEILNDLDGLLIPREQLLDDKKYEEIKKHIPELKKIFSSSCMTSLQKNAYKSQKWPLLNLARQILSFYNYKMEPIRKSDGYTLEGVKKYKRFFQIKKNNNIINNVIDNDTKIINIDSSVDEINYPNVFSNE